MWAEGNRGETEGQRKAMKEYFEIEAGRACGRIKCEYSHANGGAARIYANLKTSKKICTEGQTAEESIYFFCLLAVSVDLSAFYTWSRNFWQVGIYLDKLKIPMCKKQTNKKP